MKPYDQILRDRAGHIDFRIEESDTGPAYSLVIDLSNEGGEYPHTETGHIIIDEVVGILNKDSTPASWAAFFGVITEINDTEATVVYPHVLAIHNQDTTLKSVEVLQQPALALDVEPGGSINRSLFVHKETVAAVNTGLTLNDICGDPQTPAVGDLIMKMERLGGAMSAFVHVTIRYRTES